MKKINTYIVEKFKISKDIQDVKDEESFIVVPFGDSQEYLDEKYGDYRIICQYTCFILKESEVKNLIHMKDWDEDIEVYNIPKDYKKDAYLNIKDFENYLNSIIGNLVEFGKKLEINHELSHIIL